MTKKYTTEYFIREAKKIHGDKYDYSKSISDGAFGKVTIICPVHGEFKQSARNHLRGEGCKKCAMDKLYILRTLTTDEFIQKAKNKFGNKYDYSLVKYVASKIKVKIICPSCGVFEQQPTNHLIGYGCPKCSGLYKTTEEFIKQARKIHGDKYDYSKTNYITSKFKVIITCPIHGDFIQSPTNHLKGGCVKCGGRLRLTTEEFIGRSKIIHDNKYDYSKVNYITNTTKVTIICPIHGEFKQQPTKHMDDKNGCPKCSGSYMDTKFFIEKANIKHNNLYNYSKVNYVKATEKVIIICSEHGEFQQTPNSHLNGSGCPKCRGVGFDHVTYEKCRNVIKEFNIKTQRSYYIWWKNNKEYCRENGIPSNPEQFYKRNT